MESVARVREEVTAAPDANDNNKRQRVVTEAAASRTESKFTNGSKGLAASYEGPRLLGYFV